MSTINKDELFSNLRDFLKSKGVELTDGSYALRIRKGCDLLADTVNATQRTVKRAKVEVDRKLDQLRETIHKATAPKPTQTPKAQPASESKSSGPTGSSAPKNRTPKPRPARPSSRKRQDK